MEIYRKENIEEKECEGEKETSSTSNKEIMKKQETDNLQILSETQRNLSSYQRADRIEYDSIL